MAGVRQVRAVLWMAVTALCARAQVSVIGRVVDENGVVVSGARVELRQDSAAARAGGDGGRPPTLKRPYYGSEVSCPASPLPDNTAPTVPTGMRAPYRWPLQIGAGFVVDTSGAVVLSAHRRWASP